MTVLRSSYQTEQDGCCHCQGPRRRLVVTRNFIDGRRLIVASALYCTTCDPNIRPDDTPACS